MGDDIIIRDIRKENYNSRKEMVSFLESTIYMNKSMKVNETIARFMYFS